MNKFFGYKVKLLEVDDKNITFTYDQKNNLLLGNVFGVFEIDKETKHEQLFIIKYDLISNKYLVDVKFQSNYEKMKFKKIETKFRNQFKKKIKKQKKFFDIFKVFKKYQDELFSITEIIAIVEKNEDKQFRTVNRMDEKAVSYIGEDEKGRYKPIYLIINQGDFKRKYNLVLDENNEDVDLLKKIKESKIKKEAVK